VADFNNVGLSVLTTLTLQSIYLGVVKFPRTLKTETDALQSAMRFAKVNAEEGNFAILTSDEVTDICARAHGFLLGELQGLERDGLLLELAVIEGKLAGLSASREPEATYVVEVREGVRRTIAMMNEETMSETKVRREALSLLYSRQYSFKAFCYRVNESRLSLADEIETRSSTLETSLLEFWGAASITYVGVLIISAIALMNIGHQWKFPTWLVLIMWLVVAFCVSPLPRFFFVIGNAAKAMVRSSKLEVEHLRSSLTKLS